MCGLELETAAPHQTTDALILDLSAPITTESLVHFFYSGKKWSQDYYDLRIPEQK